MAFVSRAGSRMDARSRRTLGVLSSAPRGATAAGTGRDPPVAWRSCSYGAVSAARMSAALTASRVGQRAISICSASRSVFSAAADAKLDIEHLLDYTRTAGSNSLA